MAALPQRHCVCRYLYNSLIAGCTHGPLAGFNLGERSVQQAQQLAEEMRDAGIMPNGFTHAALMSVFAKAAMYVPTNAYHWCGDVPSGAHNLYTTPLATPCSCAVRPGPCLV